MEHQFAMQLKQMDMQQAGNAEKNREDRKDQRTRIQATQQSELIDQRNNQTPPKNFERTGSMTNESQLGDFDSI